MSPTPRPGCVLVIARLVVLREAGLVLSVYSFLSVDVEDWRCGDAEMRRCGGTNCGLSIVYV